MTAIRHKLIRLFILIVPLAGCHMTGYNDLGEPVNRFSQMGNNSVTYIRSYQDDSGPAAELFLLSDRYSDQGNFVSITLQDDSSAVQVRETIGRYVIDGRQITLTDLISYKHDYIFTDSPSGHAGAVQTDPDPSPSVMAYQRLAGSSGLILGDRHFRSLTSVIDSVCMDSSPERGERFMKIFLLYTLVNHCRIEGFGGIGMLMYLGKTTRFDGLLFGHLDFSAEGLNEITSTFHYINHSDLTHMVLNGSIVNKTDRSGTGKMSGIIRFTVTGSAQTWTGSVDYSGIRINHSLPSGGHYRLKLEGEEYLTDYQVTNPGGFDIRDAVPEE